MCACFAIGLLGHKPFVSWKWMRVNSNVQCSFIVFKWFTFLFLIAWEQNIKSISGGMRAIAVKTMFCFSIKFFLLRHTKKNRRVGPTNRFRWHCSSEWNVISTICDILAIAGVDDCIVIDDCKYCYFSRYSAERSHTHTIEHNTSPIQIESGLNVFWVCRRNAQRAFHSMNFGAQFKFGWLRWVTNRAITTKGCTWKWYTNTPN